MTYYAYERISTREERHLQKYDRQHNAIKKYCAANHIDLDFERDVYQEDASGKDFNRPLFQKLVNTESLLNNKELKGKVHTGDTIIFKDLSRFTRECDNGYKLYMALRDNGVNMIFIDNPTISTEYIDALFNTAKAQGERVTSKALTNTIELLLIVELDRVEKEREIFIQRVKDGIKASKKKNGRPFGTTKLTPELEADIKAYIQDRSIQARPIIKKHGITYNTFYKYLKLIKM